MFFFIYSLLETVDSFWLNLLTRSVADKDETCLWYVCIFMFVIPSIYGMHWNLSSLNLALTVLCLEVMFNFDTPNLNHTSLSQIKWFIFFDLFIYIGSFTFPLRGIIYLQVIFIVAVAVAVNKIMGYLCCESKLWGLVITSVVYKGYFCNALVAWRCS